MPHIWVNLHVVVLCTTKLQNNDKNQLNPTRVPLLNKYLHKYLQGFRSYLESNGIHEQSIRDNILDQTNYRLKVAKDPIT
mgnify:CR=1 FL=1